MPVDIYVCSFFVRDLYIGVMELHTPYVVPTNTMAKISRWWCQTSPYLAAWSSLIQRFNQKVGLVKAYKRTFVCLLCVDLLG